MTQKFPHTIDEATDLDFTFTIDQSNPSRATVRFDGHPVKVFFDPDAGAKAIGWTLARIENRNR